MSGAPPSYYTATSVGKPYPQPSENPEFAANVPSPFVVGPAYPPNPNPNMVGPPPPGFQPYHGGANPVPTPMVPQVHTVYIGSMTFNQDPMHMICPHCHADIVTAIAPRRGLLTWLLCGGLAFFGCWCCCCIPFCVDSCQDIEHNCPACKRYLGVYKRI